MKKKTSKKKYALGTDLDNYVTNPLEALYKNNFYLDQAKYEGVSDPLSLIFGALSGIATSTLPRILENKSKTNYAMGGSVEVEGNEVAKTPSGNLLKFKGNSHEEGGIDVNLPDNTDIYSKRIKIDGKTMAERKLKRENREKKYLKLIEKNDDQVYKNTLERIKENNSKDELLDKSIQSVIGNLTDQNKGKVENDQYAFGTYDKAFKPYPYIDGAPYSPQMLEGLSNLGTPYKDAVPYQYPVSEAESGNSRSFLGDFSIGDIMGIAGNAFQSVSPYLNTLNNKAKTPVNINQFKNYGKEALKTLDKSSGILESQQDRALKDLNLSRNSSINRNRSSARGLNTLKAFDLAADANVNTARENIINHYGESLIRLLNNKAQFQNDKDAKVMQGEYMADVANRQDQDNFNTQLGQDKLNIGKGITNIGSILNKKKKSKVENQLLNALSPYFNVDVNSGKLTGKNNIPKSIDLSTKYPDLSSKRGVSQEDIIGALRQILLKNNTKK